MAFKSESKEPTECFVMIGRDKHGTVKTWIKMDMTQTLAEKDFKLFTEANKNPYQILAKIIKETE